MDVGRNRELGQQALKFVGDSQTANGAATEAATRELAALPERYFELYGLAVEMADRTSARRLTANTFFVTVNTGLAALLGARSFQWYVAVAGVLLCLVWWGLLKSYRDLNAAKFTVINAMEQRLSAAIFSEEWAHLRRDPVRFSWSWEAIKKKASRYRELGVIERSVPVLFALIYIASLLSKV